MGILSWMFGSDDAPKKVYSSGSGKTGVGGTSSKTPSSGIVDPKRISMVKAHTIVGSVERYGHATKFAKLVTWLEANEVAVASAALSDLENLPSHALALRPAMPGGCLAVGPGCFGGLKLGEPVYVLGDTHGDLESLVAIFDTIIDTSLASRDNDSPTIYLLGDILDRSTETCAQECVFLLAILQKALPKEFEKYNKIKLGIVKGDHDVALSYPKAYSTTSRFTSAVKPADYCDWLNERLDLNKGNEDATLIGRAWIRLMEACPAAAFLEEAGCLISHGGIPRSDVQAKITSGETPFIAQSECCATDYEWCRMVDAKNKLLNRASKTSEVGFQEFESLSNNVFFGKIRKFIFGHQHPARGFQRLEKFYPGYDVMCISSFRKDDTLGGPTVPHFCKVEKDEVNVYSMSPAAYVIRLEENSIEHHKKTEVAAPAAAGTAPTSAVRWPGTSANG